MFLKVDDITIRATTELPASFDRLVKISTSEAHEFLARTLREWQGEVNSFSKPGEVFFLAYSGETLIGCGGVNIDPYSSEASLGRIRHVYVAPEYRRQGVASLILDACIKHSLAHFKALRLKANTLNRGSHDFYKKLGFHCTSEDPQETHRLELRHIEKHNL